ncbi:MAG: hypothetical protein JWO31_2946, partial [Phycisphaerales bacterium]|nr:hypothetical protein [Phycisphaerales bacterium]
AAGRAAGAAKTALAKAEANQATADEALAAAERQLLDDGPMPPDRLPPLRYAAFRDDPGAFGYVDVWVLEIIDEATALVLMTYGDPGPDRPRPDGRRPNRPAEVVWMTGVDLRGRAEGDRFSVLLRKDGERREELHTYVRMAAVKMNRRGEVARLDE